MYTRSIQLILINSTCLFSRPPLTYWLVGCYYLLPPQITKSEVLQHRYTCRYSISKLLEPPISFIHVQPLTHFSSIYCLTLSLSNTKQAKVVKRGENEPNARAKNGDEAEPRWGCGLHQDRAREDGGQNRTGSMVQQSKTWECNSN